MQEVDYEKAVIKELLNSYDRGELNINPWYQRRSVWTTQQKAFLINSVLEKKPIPSLYIRHYLDIDTEKSIKEVVDGQQRIRSILEYVTDEFTARHPRHKNRLKYSQLSPTERRGFLMTPLSIGYLIEADDGDVIEIFGRLNSVAKTINSQERRNAKYGGEAKQFCLKQAAKRVSLWRDLRIFTANDIARMIEVEFVSELALNMLAGLSDHSAAIIDRFYWEHDEQFAEQDDLDARFENVFAKIAELNPSAIKDTIFARPPLFFTACIILDSIHCDIEKSRLEKGLFEIDIVFNRDIPLIRRESTEADFVVACMASTQRIRQRRVRDRYVRRKLGLTQ